MNSQENIQHSATMEDRYRCAKTLMEGFLSKKLVQNDTIFPNWIEDTNYFWYERTTKQGEGSPAKIGKEYRLVDAKAKNNEAAFDHEALANALAEASSQSVDKKNLPISDITLSLSPLTVSFTAFDQYWKFSSENKHCQRIEKLDIKFTEALSPDGKLLAFSRDYNLWVRDVITGEERALTFDGEDDYAYAGKATIRGLLRPGMPALWSPDSTQLLVLQRDKRLVKTLPIVDHVPQDGSIRPILQEIKIAYPGDEQEESYRVSAINVSTGKICVAQYNNICCTYFTAAGFFEKVVWWAQDSKRAYLIDPERGDKAFRLVEFDTTSGATKVLFEEVSETYINFAGGGIDDPLARYLPKTNELIWWSERSGWGHLYLYDLNTGKLKQTITSGDWLVRNILSIDEQCREILIQTSARVSGRDPYYRDICRVQIDTGEITTVFSCDQETSVYYPSSPYVKMEIMAGRTSSQTSGVSPDGNYIVVTQSRVDQGSVTLLIDREGNELLELESTDSTGLPSDWEWPDPVQVLAADGQTPLYGMLFRPFGFSPEKTYPVINFIASGPWASVVPKASFHSANSFSTRHYFHMAALAALGFVVVILDSRGTPLRSKSFQDESYGWIPSSANTADHAGAIEQLAERYPYMDINRVGIFCQAYRSGLQNFLERQDLYKVCVQMSLTDDRMNTSVYGEKYEGFDGSVAERYYPEQLADNLQGKLLLMNSMCSAIGVSYPVAATFRVIDALQKANKDFDMLIVPHGGFLCDDYMFRRAFDYLVKHLLNTAPPKEFTFSGVKMTFDTAVKSLK